MTAAAEEIAKAFLEHEWQEAPHLLIVAASADRAGNLLGGLVEVFERATATRQVYHPMLRRTYVQLGNENDYRLSITAMATERFGGLLRARSVHGVIVSGELLPVEELMQGLEVICREDDSGRWTPRIWVAA